jgi:hypothetical protein
MEHMINLLKTHFQQFFYNFAKRDKQPDWCNTEVQYARQMRDKFNKLDMWAEYKFWRNRTKQILDEAKQNFYNNMLKESKDPNIIWKCIHSLNPSNHIRPHLGYSKLCILRYFIINKVK